MATYDPIDPDQSAFPSKVNPNEAGLTKREYLAAIALGALLSNPDWIREGENNLTIAHTAIAYADQLINALNE